MGRGWLRIREWSGCEYPMDDVTEPHMGGGHMTRLTRVARVESHCVRTQWRERCMTWVRV